MRTRLLALLALTLAGGCSDADVDPVAPDGFEEFAWQSGVPDVRSERLCPEADAPDRPPVEEIFVDCALEGADLGPARTAEAADEIRVVTWNILRGFESDRQIQLLLDGAFGPVPDILLLSEVDRGCGRTEFRNVAREYAEAFGYYYVYGVEFLELPGSRGPTGPYDPPICEHGNAIVSRYPLGNVRLIRHAANRSWYTPPDHPDPDEPRLGGRMAIRADANVNGRLVRLYSLHLESVVAATDIKNAQAEEIALDGMDADVTIVGGDFNAYSALSDIQTGQTNDAPTQSFLQRGYVDAHAGLDPDDRATSLDVGLVIDFLFSRGTPPLDAGLCPEEQCRGLSDHLPLWATFPRPGRANGASR